MRIKTTLTDFPGLVIVEVERFTDERGFFMEPWNKRDFSEAGLTPEFVQEGHSRSGRGVLRGLHYQDMQAPQEKLVRCVVGEVFDVVVDLRVGSPTFGKWYSIVLSAENGKQLYVPVGFAHGFQAISDVSELQYKLTGFYDPKAEGSILWSDPDVGVSWPIANPILSPKDAVAQTFAQYKERPVFAFNSNE